MHLYSDLMSCARGLQLECPFCCFFTGITQFLLPCEAATSAKTFPTIKKCLKVVKNEKKIDKKIRKRDTKNN